ncbi:MAG: 3-deoxy-8-phosphooctulonate synthase [Actinomycetia bacterium]|nr:3-deoxy-8-phosphooctulonate synthase [Actinomycetes bacterium]
MPNNLYKKIKSDFTLIAGPCVIESEGLCMNIAKTLKDICQELNINYIFKASFDKANRSSIKSYRGVSLNKGIEIFSRIKQKIDVPILTDCHLPSQCEALSKIVDILQIPSFLCRQTDLLIAAAKTGKIINIKKGQFMAPWEMKNVVEKIENTGNFNIALCERGTSFGYNRLVVDYTGMLEMKKLGYPVIFDATHSVQLPGSLGNKSGGSRDYVPFLINASIAIGITCIFAEVHPDPNTAKSDGPNMLYLDNMYDLLSNALSIYNIVNNK